MMKKLIANRKLWLYLVFAVGIILGVILILSSLKRHATVIVDEVPYSVETNAWKVSGVLRKAGLTVSDDDLVVPPTNKWIGQDTVIHVTTAQTITVVTEEEEYTLVTAERIPAKILEELEIDFDELDQVLLNGVVINPQTPLVIHGPVVLEYRGDIRIDIEIDSLTQTIYTNQPTLGEALEAASINVNPFDWVSVPLSTPIEEPISVRIRRAQPVTVRVDDTEFTGKSAAPSVGLALEDVGLPLQNLDYSIPPEDEPIPEDRVIEIIRVSEDVVIATDETAYESEYVEDPETELDQYSVVQPGQVGLYATRERIQYENGEEAERKTEGSWQASIPQNELLGYGTKVVIRTEVVDGVTIEYWRKKYVYATSYEPCDNQGVCHDGTAGGYPLQIGIVAVTPQWYSVPNGLAMADLPVYVPGYGQGIIGDVGGGISGTPWIDVAYRPEDDFTWDAHWLTMYFLTPVPSWYAAIITP